MGISQAFFSAPPKKNSRGKNSIIQKLKEKNSNSSKKLHFSAFLWNFFKRLEKIMNFSLPYVKKLEKLLILTKNSMKNLKLKDFSKNSSQKTQFPAFSKSKDLRKVH